MPTIEEMRNAMRSAQVWGKGRYFQEGRYKLEVAKLFYKRTVIGTTANENIICEFKIETSSRADVEIGSTQSVVFAFKHAGWINRFKAMMVALLGSDPDGKITPELDAATSDLLVALMDDNERQKQGLPENFMAGSRVFAEAIPGLSVGKQKPITNMKWTPVPQTQAAA